MHVEPPSEWNTLRGRLRRALRSAGLFVRRHDSELYTKVNRMPHPAPLNLFMRFVARVMNRGDGWLFGLLLSALFDSPADRRRKIRRMHRIALPLWLATATVEFPLKSFFRRERPFLKPELGILIGKVPRRHSFPSGHSASAFAGAWLLSRQYPRWRVLFYAIALIVGFCRVYLGAHYPSDVVVGAASGVGLAAFYRRALRALATRSTWFQKSEEGAAQPESKQEKLT